MEKMNCLAVSKGYWPINYENSTSFELPEPIKKVFEEYAQLYAAKRTLRRIQYHNSLGHVNLTLSFQNGDYVFKCLPIHAVMIGYFD
jgi:anaphase-promoting complex subunit 2